MPRRQNNSPEKANNLRVITMSLSNIIVEDLANMNMEFEVLCFVDVPSALFITSLKKLWLHKYPFSAIHLECEQAVFSKYPIGTSSFRRASDFTVKMGNDIGLYEINYKNRVVQFYVTMFPINAVYRQVEGDKRQYVKRALQAYNTAQYIKNTRGNSDYQVLIGGLALQPGDTAHKCLLYVSDLIQPHRYNFLYRSRMNYKLNVDQIVVIEDEFFEVYHNERYGAFNVEFTDTVMDEPPTIDLSGSNDQINAVILLCDDIIHFYTKRRRPFLAGGLVCLIFSVILGIWVSGGFLYQLAYGVALFGTAIVLIYAGYAECLQRTKPYVDARNRLIFMKNTK
ncbi:unnamed protein product [Diamesa hyperborea]